MRNWTVLNLKWIIPAICWMFIVVSVTGCAVPPAPPAGCEQSVIYKVATRMHTTPQMIGALFQIGSIELIKSKPTVASQLVQFLNELDVALEDDTLTYLELVVLIQVRVRNLQTQYGHEIMILLTTFMNQLSQPIPLDQCDRSMIRKHINNQLVILNGM